MAPSTPTQNASTVDLATVSPAFDHPAPHAAASLPLSGKAGDLLAKVVRATELFSAVALAVDVAIVFVSVVLRYFLHSPVSWAEEVASALMVVQVFLGAATTLARGGHSGIDVFRGYLPTSWQASIVQLCYWIVLAVSAGLFLAMVDLTLDTLEDTTPFGLSTGIFTYPALVGSLFMAVFATANALAGPARTVWATLGGAVALVVGVWAWNDAVPSYAVTPGFLLCGGFLITLLLGVPIAFALAFASLLYFLTNPTLPMLIYAQQILSGSEHFVLLAIPFFVLAGLAMEVNGMSLRLIELLLRLMGRVRGGFNLILIVATAIFSGISGSKLADVAAVGGILMPAIRKTRQDPNDAAGLLACTAIMSETIPPCVNMIIFGFVANISIGGLFAAGLLPASVLLVALAVVAVYCGKRVDPDEAFEIRTPWPSLIAGALVGLVMIVMIGRGVMAGIATSTEISAFAVVYALVVGGLAFRELTWSSVVALFVRASSLTGAILFIVAAASSVSFALTIEQIPQQLSAHLVAFGLTYGKDVFLVAASLMMIAFGAVLEGAPALIIFGPLLTPIAAQLGVDPLHFGTIMVISMGLGLFSPPVGLGLFATCTITGTQLKDVVRPMGKYLAVLFLALLVLIFVPTFSLLLPRLWGF